MAPAVDVMDTTQTPGQVKKENKETLNVLEELLSKLSVSKAQDEINESSSEIASFINGDIQEGDAPVK